MRISALLPVTLLACSSPPSTVCDSTRCPTGCCDADGVCRMDVFCGSTGGGGTAGGLAGGAAGGGTAGGSAGGGTGGSAGGAVRPASVPPVGPLLVGRGPGRVLNDAWVVTISYNDVPAAAEIAAFGDFLPQSAWLSAVGRGYGVAALGHTHYDAPVPSPATFFDYQVPAFIDRGIDAGWWPAKPGDGGTPLWLVVHGPRASGNGALGKHYEEGTRVVGWVAPGGDGGVARYQTILAHELIEAMTDPYPFTAPGWQIFNDARFNWYPGSSYLYNGEVADLCEDQEPVVEAGFTLPLSWSNVAMDGGLPPCQPVSTPFASVWGPIGSVQLDPGQSVQVQLMPVGSLASFDLKLSRGLFSTTWTHLSVAANRAMPGVPIVATFSADAVAPHGTSEWFELDSAPDAAYPGYTPLWIFVR